MAISSARREPILIYGAGAIGTLLGGRLAASGAPVTLLGRPELQQAVAANGLQVELPETIVSVTPTVVTSIEQLPEPPAIILLAAKAYSVSAALPDLQQLAAGGAVLVSLQNGIGTEESLLRSESIKHVCAGSFTLSVSSSRPGEVRQEPGKGGIALAPVSGDITVSRLAERFEQAGFNVMVRSDYRAMKWSKLLLNLMANAVSALSGRLPAEVYHDRVLFEVERRAFLETRAVMRVLGISPVSLPGFNVPLIARIMRLPAPLAQRLLAPRIAGGRGNKPPSLWLDIERGRTTTEIDWLNGAVARVGAELGVPTPVNARLADTIRRTMIDSELRTDLSANPRRLAHALGQG